MAVIPIKKSDNPIFFESFTDPETNELAPAQSKTAYAIKLKKRVRFNWLKDPILLYTFLLFWSKYHLATQAQEVFYPSQ